MLKYCLLIVLVGYRTVKGLINEGKLDSGRQSSSKANLVRGQREMENGKREQVCPPSGHRHNCSYPAVAHSYLNVFTLAV